MAHCYCDVRFFEKSGPRTKAGAVAAMPITELPTISWRDLQVT